MPKNKELTVAQLKSAAKKLGFHVTQNANTAHVAKSLFIANKRLEQAEAIFELPQGEQQKIAIFKYKNKWWV